MGGGNIMAKTLDDLMKIKGVAACGAWRPSSYNKRLEILGSRGDMPEEAGFMASAFCEFDLFTANTQCAIYEQYTRHERFFPAAAIAIRGKEYSVLAVYSKKGNYMVGCFMRNGDEPDLWKLSEEMMEVEI